MTTLADFDDPAPFRGRHIGPNEADQAEMLDALGYSSLDEMTKAVVPASILGLDSGGVAPGRTEDQVQGYLREIAQQNRPMHQMIGMGYYDTIMPGVIRRNVLENPAWYTAYTPYQAEISQGRLEALLVFQTVVSDLTGLAVANASLLDEASAAAEAMILCLRQGSAPAAPDGRPTFVVDADCLPQTIAVLRTRAAPLGINLVVRDLTGDQVGLPPGNLAGVLFQYPGTSGSVRDLAPLLAAAHERGALGVVAADPLALCLLRSPGELGADVAIGSTQRFGVSLGFGGPHAAYIAVRRGLERSLPGRVVGVSRDAEGSPAMRLALQTREQHIRRDRATSNICTAQVLPAVLAAMYAVYHGPDGLRRIAGRVHHHASLLADGLSRRGVEVVHPAFFDTVLARVPGRAAAVVAAAAEAGINLRLLDADHVGISCDERTTAELVDSCLDAFPSAEPTRPGPGSLPAELRRSSDFLTHRVFHQHGSETSMLRYLRQLSDRDYGLDRGMIPLGSCTMKLNATFEMEPITWPEFASIHPFAPASQTRGYAKLIGDLEEWLCRITGYAAISLQPNAGSQGELAGLLAIRAYQHAQGETQRDVCLIPSSAHGTNAASAVLAGMRVIPVACDEEGNVDLVDLEARIAEHGDRLSALMVTYPSTHGVYEEGIVEVCEAVHKAGGQVYLDGANLNALVGMASIEAIGSDVSHLNLHKTFCIPHGGGGPGVGPVAVREHLAPYLPADPLDPDPISPGPIAASRWGSAGVLPITWSYIRLMGSDGLAQASKVAVASANYLAKRLSPYFGVLYSGQSGMVAHECILDLRPLTRATGVTVTDVAKRLIDYGFHAPTVSFPVAGTLMVEPTESEDLAELNRFCDAMVAIRAEIDKVAGGDWPRDDNPLKGAPHTAVSLAADWTHPYSRLEAAFPLESLRRSKYWPPVARIDEAWGDRNLSVTLPQGK